ncbi:hypothetical protein ACIQVL_48830 [Streptomyces sp. NPDC090499]|uniref:hypothetical protein n=1 Tax=Streptomyces sp. NPDC090499 TaxID=3365965 RepID=UPI003830A7E2
MTDMLPELPEGHPLPWDELVPYEKDQGGYWLYPKGGDVYGNDKIWVRVPNPERAVEQPSELDRYRNQVRSLAQQISSRAQETGSENMAALAREVERAAGNARAS